MKTIEKICTVCGINKSLEDFCKGRDKYGKAHRCRSCASEYHKKWRNSPKGSEIYKQSKIRFKESLLKKGFTIYEYYKESYIRRDKAYRVSEAGKNGARVVRHKRRSRILGLDESFDKAQWEKLINFYSPNKNCLCCRKHENLNADHVVPLSRGGGNSISNIQPLCPTCNRKKFTKTIDYRFDRGMFALILEIGDV